MSNHPAGMGWAKDGSIGSGAPLGVEGANGLEYRKDVLGPSPR